MALIKCPECQKEISEKAKSCPNCGFPINTSICILNGKECDLSFLLDENYDYFKKVKDVMNLVDPSLKLKETDSAIKKIIETKTIPKVLNLPVYEKEINNKESNKNAPTCPHCGSTNIQLGTRGFSLMTGFIGSSSPRYYCLKCHHKWKPNSMMESVTRAWNKK